MKIGIDCRIFSSNFTGIGRYTHELVNELIKINDKIHSPHSFVLFFNQPEYRTYKTKSPNVKKILVNIKHYSLAEQTKFLHILNKEKLDITYFPHFNIPIFYKRPYIVTIHDLTLSFFPGKKMTKFYHRIAYSLTIKNAVRRAKYIIAVSENTKKDIIKHLHISAQKIKVIYNGISDKFKFIKDTLCLQKTLKKYNITKEFLLYTGVWRNHKNLVNLIRAFEIIKNTSHLNLQLVITGKPDPSYPEIKKTANNSRMKNDIIFTGLIPEEDLINLYNAAHIYVFPSLYEGFGFPPLEAMKCGTPVAASFSSSIPEICGKENAVFFDPYDTNDMAKKIIMLYKNTDLKKSLIEKGKKHVIKFSWKKMAQETFNLITNTLKN